MTWGFEVLVQLVMAAITTSPSRHLVVGRRRRLGRRRLRGARSSATRKASLAAASGTRSWGRDGPGQRGLDVGEVERDVARSTPARARSGSCQRPWALA